MAALSFLFSAKFRFQKLLRLRIEITVSSRSSLRSQIFPTPAPRHILRLINSGKAKKKWFHLLFYSCYLFNGFSFLPAVTRRTADISFRTAPPPADNGSADSVRNFKQIAELFPSSSIPKLAADDPRKRGKRIEKKANYLLDLLISCRHLLLQQSCVVGKPRAGAYSYDQKTTTT